MRKLVFTLLIAGFSMLFSEYNIGDTVNLGDNISWTDNYGYSSNIFAEIQKGKVVMIFFGDNG